MRHILWRHPHCSFSMRMNLISIGWQTVTGGVPLDQTAHPVLETVLQAPALVVVIVVLVVRVSVARVVITLSLILSPVT